MTLLFLHNFNIFSFFLLHGSLTQQQLRTSFFLFKRLVLHWHTLTRKNVHNHSHTRCSFIRVTNTLWHTISIIKRRGLHSKILALWVRINGHLHKHLPYHHHH